MNEKDASVNSRSPEWLFAGQIPSLGGLRALSVILIILYHGSMNGDDSIFETWKWFWRKGEIGVDIFFAISGFLISTLLFREWDRTAGVSLTRFYFRRSIRIIPPLLAYLLFVFILCNVGIVNASVRDWTASLTYTVNFFDAIPIPLGHLWSLSVEEHFYFLWPPIVLLLGPRRSGWAAMTCLACEPLVRWLTLRYSHFDIDFVTFTRLDAIAGGCLLAVAARGGLGSGLLRVLERLPFIGFVAMSGCLLVSLFIPARFVTYTVFLSPTVNAVCICAVLWLGMRFNDTIYGRFFNWTPLVAIGRMSYSLYLWQQVFLDWHSSWWACKFPQNILLATFCAWCSYVFIETPANNVKNQLGKRRIFDPEPPLVTKKPTPLPLRMSSPST